MSLTTLGHRAAEPELLRSVFEQVARDLSLILDREIAVSLSEAERVESRIAGRDRVHISFGLELRNGDEVRHGAVLVPLPDAITLAMLLLMVGEEELEASRHWSELDRSTKEALLEVGHFVSGAADHVAREAAPGWTVRSAGCQGVRADVRPAFPYREGDPLVAGRCRARIGEFPEFEMVAMLPPLAD